jgi:hypothetical protein
MRSFNKDGQMCAGRVVGVKSMKIKYTVRRFITWDREDKILVIRWKVSAVLLGKNNDPIMSNGPLFAETQQDVIEAKTILGTRLKQRWASALSPPNSD